MATYRTTANLQLRTPSGAVGEAPDGPGGMATLADDVDTMLGIGGAERATNLAAITAIPSARTFTGKMAYAADTGYLYRYTGATDGWVLWDTARTWQAFTYATGFSSLAGIIPLRWAIRAGILHVQGGVQGTFASNTPVAVTTTANVPPAVYRPAAGLQISGGAYGQGARPAAWRYEPDGTVQVGWNNGGTTYTAPAWVDLSFALPYGMAL